MFTRHFEVSKGARSRSIPPDGKIKFYVVGENWKLFKDLYEAAFLARVALMSLNIITFSRRKQSEQEKIFFYERTP